MVQLCPKLMNKFRDGAAGGVCSFGPFLANGAVVDDDKSVDPSVPVTLLSRSEGAGAKGMTKLGLSNGGVTMRTAVVLPTQELKHTCRTDLNKAMACYLDGRSLHILEAGCGRRWPFEKGSHIITGIDQDIVALRHRKEMHNDLDHIILGDLRTVEIAKGTFDLIYCSYVLEHLDGAESVLDRFLLWLKPGGLLILKFPDRDSVYGFCTRITPLWVHVLFKRYVQGNRKAGLPGCDPYPTFYDKVVSRSGMLAYAESHELTVLDERGFSSVRPLVQLLITLVGWVTFHRLASDHVNLMYVLKKSR